LARLEASCGGPCHQTAVDYKHRRNGTAQGWVELDRENPGSKNLKSDQAQM
jgi:hypothetical protein